VLDEVHPRREPEAISVGVIKEVVAVHYGVSPAELESATRASRVSWPRQVAIHLARGLTDISLQAIGREFGGRNHATVLHACRRVEERVGNDQQAVDEIEEIKRSIVHGRRDRSS
jgi:chromosomal replication initiator protein